MTNQGTPFPGEYFFFPSYGNVGSPFISTLSLPGLSIGLSVWFLSTPVILNALGALDASTPPQENQIDVDPSPSLPVRYSSFSSYSPSKTSEASNQMNKKKKKNKEGTKIPSTICHVGNKKPTTVHHVENVYDVVKTTKIARKVYHILKVYHVLSQPLLKDFPVLSKVIEVWSTGSQKATSLAFGHHVVDNPSTSHNAVGENKIRVKFPCRLCEGSHQTYLFPSMDEASCLLEKIVDVQQKIPTNYHRLSPNSPLVDQLVDLTPSLVDPTLPSKSEVKVVYMIPSSLISSLPLESEVNKVVDSIPCYLSRKLS
jgi:hypothetical protein